MSTVVGAEQGLEPDSQNTIQVSHVAGRLSHLRHRHCHPVGSALTGSWSTDPELNPDAATWPAGISSEVAMRSVDYVVSADNSRSCLFSVALEESRPLQHYDLNI